MLKPYLKRIYEIANRGDAREESYYSILEDLLKEYTNSVRKKDIRITTLPKKTEAGNPDFRIWDGKQHIVGYIEAKAPTVEQLDHIQTTEQLKRYRHTFPNLILTNFFEFRLYRNGTLIDKVLIGRPFIVHKLKAIPPVEKESDFLKMLERFFSFSLPKVYDAKTLAIELAKRTRFLKEEVIAEELIEKGSGKGFISGFYEAFRKYLISGLSKEEFEDLYSQTITYGLFAARTRSEDGFNRKLAYDNIPHTIGILRDVFKFISLGDLPKQMEWIIDDISEVLAVTDVKNILHQYFHEGKGKDPVVHFYETFLAEYDPKTREKRGVYYTPEHVVSYIVHSLHQILKEHFNRADGFANNSVTVLDPAAGTLTFLAEAAKLAVEEFVSKYGEGGKENFIKEHVLKNLYAFELMMAPYAVGHLKMSFLLEELGYKLQEDDRFKLYLTNTLEMEELAQTELPGMSSLSEESHLAGKVKKEQPILVILGNPPYSGISANLSEKEVTITKGQEYVTNYQIQKDKVNAYFKLISQTKKARREIKVKQKTWIGELIEHYKIIDGQWLKEKNPKWLQDDYVKFIRFAQWKINQAGEGVLGFITNHSYLDNPTFRGMRQSLMNSFNEIYILDLHGNSLKKEKCPDGSKDENVFEIQQGVAIALFIKKQDEKTEAKVYHSEIWGLRENKNDWLSKNDVKTATWRKLSPKSEFYLFIPRDERLLESYEKFPKITDIFPLNSVGIVTARDKLTIKWTSEEMWSTALSFSKMDSELARLAYNLGKDVRDWKVELAKKDLLENGLDRKGIIPILYRPFDIRYTYYTGKSRGFHCMPRPEIMRHMLQENLALCIGRAGQVVGLEKPWNIVFCSDCIEDFNLFYRGGNVNFPLYIYPDTGNSLNQVRSTNRTIMMIFEPAEAYRIKKPNINQAFIDLLTKTYANMAKPEEIFYYIYAILYSNTYRRKYADFLKIDFPRIPFPKDYKLFNKMAAYGQSLIDLHLLKSVEIDQPIAKFHGKGDERVDKLRYDEKEKRVYINQSQYFEGVTKEVWQYQIGGYQVCNKWLKDRKKRLLSLDDIKHYCKIVTSLQKTIEAQKAIDDIYPEVEKETVEIENR
jgi:predicted helicase